MPLAVREACAARDISTIFGFLVDSGMSQRELAVLVKMNQSEIVEILKGRQVQAYDMLVRIADGLGIPRGLMGLAYGEHDRAQPVGEVDEDVERRKLLAIAGALLFGAPIFGQPEPLAVRRVLADPPRRVGMADVRMYEQTLLQLLVSDVHRRAGWAAGDVGLIDDYRAHMHAALDLAAGDPDRVALVLCTAGAIEKSLGDPEFSLKLLQVGQTAAATSTDPQVRAVLGGEAVAGYVAMGRPDMARKELAAARSLFADADVSQSLHGFAAYGNGHGVLASAEQKLGNYDAARTEILTALRKRPKDDAWCNALDTIILATINMQAGEIGAAVQDTQRALMLVQRVGSPQLHNRMMPLADELGRRNDSTCRDLARAVRTVEL